MAEDVKFFENQTGILARISVRSDGDMQIKKNGFGDVIKNPNRKVFFDRYQIPEGNVVAPVLEHRNRVTVVTEDTKANIFSDALVTSLVGEFLSVLAGDCYPVFLFDPVNRVIGLAHGGRRPLVSGIIFSTIEEMLSLGAARKNIIAEVGPGICQRNYIWRKEDLYKLRRYDRPKFVLEIIDDHERVRVFLEQIIEDQLVMASISKVHFSMECTCCNPEKYFSDRQGSKKRMLAVIGMTG